LLVTIWHAYYSCRCCNFASWPLSAEGDFTIWTQSGLLGIKQRQLFDVFCIPFVGQCQHQCVLVAESRVHCDTAATSPPPINFHVAVSLSLNRTVRVDAALDSAPTADGASAVNVYCTAWNVSDKKDHTLGVNDYSYVLPESTGSCQAYFLRRMMFVQC